MGQTDWAAGVDTTRAHAARVYNWMLGGRHYFPADREAGEKLAKITPYFPLASRANRAFLRRVVSFLAQKGIRQFLDIGAGLPSDGNVHEIAPQARVVYVDNDPVVLAHGRALVAPETDRVRYIGGDARHPEEIRYNAEVRNFIDWDEPLAILMIGLLHFISDEDKPQSTIDFFRHAVPPGSYVAVSHATCDGFTPPRSAAIAEVYRDTVSPTWMRTREQVQELMSGFPEMVAPGLVYVPNWHPDKPHQGAPAEVLGVYGGVATVPAWIAG
ncbi:SAM-dependent methyltransferase [Sphaerisporangium album]|uniref:SAM-dependent methyltransferase n=1 Tax=Sphaerisporangium album TaxID=509200 RepID=UPI0015F0C04C|nr:SAM-dependent methyltransferase [Sphaerisporangium album]